MRLLAGYERPRSDAWCYREYIIALEPLDKGLMERLLSYPYEVRSEDEYFDEMRFSYGTGLNGFNGPAHTTNLGVRSSNLFWPVWYRKPAVFALETAASVRRSTLFEHDAIGAN
jgi:hypothetical protein